MNIIKINFWFILTILGSVAVYAQEATTSCDEAQRFFEHFKGVCQSKISAHNCIHLDVTDSYDFEGKEFEFRWEMGDGTQLEGMEVNHCYQNPGRYKAVLTLFDPLTKAVINDEAEVDVTIKGAFKLNLDLPVSGEVNRALAFSYDLSYPEDVYQIDRVYWYFGDGVFSCDSDPSHSFLFPDSFISRLMVKLSFEGDEVVLCTRDTVEIKMPDPTRDLFRAMFDSMDVASRFLADDVYYKILKKESNSYQEVSDTDTLSGRGIFQLLAFSGPLLYGSSEILTADTSSNNSIRALINAEAKALVQTEPLRVEPIFFELDQDDLSKRNKKEIKKTVGLLEEFPMLTLAVGVYTNSKGSLSKGIELSVERANLIRNYMVESGIDPGRIVVENPSTSRSLINTCVTADDCGYVDSELDRKAEFKILNQLK